MKLKSRIRDYSKMNNIPAQVVLQNYMFECFLKRLSTSKYKNNFIIKGGVLIASIVGLSTRSTMDLDTTLCGAPLSKKSLKSMINTICHIQSDDDIKFTIVRIDETRKKDTYLGYRVRINAEYDTIITPLSIDITTGDEITPSPVKYCLKGIIDETVSIEIWAYNIETVLAEKAETILSRGVFSTRPRDFYDVYILMKTNEVDRNIFQSALIATTKHRGTHEVIGSAEDIINILRSNKILRNEWEKYQAKFNYAKNISFEDTIDALIDLMHHRCNS